MSYDVIDAVLATQIASFKNAEGKARALSELKRQPYFEDLATAFKRVDRIIEDDVSSEVDPELLKEDAEKALFRKFAGIKPTVVNQTQAGDYAGALAKIVEIKDEVDAFFDHVMVNVDDPALRGNRMALLKSIAGLFSPLADFSKIVIKKTEKKMIPAVCVSLFNVMIRRSIVMTRRSTFTVYLNRRNDQ